MKYKKILQKIKKYNTILEDDNKIEKKSYATAITLFTALINLSKQMKLYLNKCYMDGINFEKAQMILENHLNPIEKTENEGDNNE